MSCNFLLAFCATLFCLYFSTGVAQNRVLQTRFTCQGRPSGYYADVETGCRVYHMCDGLGRQFSYTCPNTTLFQQRMLICDHWYMVNCSKSESDYDANLLIGQRDKPFVSEADMQLRTPRPDILSVPPNNNYYDGLREAELQGSNHPGNSIVGIPDIISSANNNGLDSAKQNYRPPTSWSTGTSVTQSKRPSQGSFDTGHNDHDDNDNLAGAASQTPGPLFHPTPEDSFSQNTGRLVPSPPPQELLPPATPRTTTTEAAEDDYIDIRMKDSSEDTEKDAVVKFIKRFDPNSPDSIKTAMSQSEILNLNKHLPAGQSSAEEERTPRKHETSNTANSFNFEGTKGVTETTRFNAVNIKPTSTSFNGQSGIPEPDKDLLPPNADSKPQPSTTVGPPVYYDWKWAVPAFDLTPPNGDNVSENASAAPQARSVQGKRPFSDVTRPTPTEPDLTPFLHNTEYNISSYFVPDYVFPLDKDHPGYEDDNAQTSFQVNVGKPGRTNFGENPACPHCHPAYLKPGSCEPCIVRR